MTRFVTSLVNLSASIYSFSTIFDVSLSTNFKKLPPDRATIAAFFTLVKRKSVKLQNGAFRQCKHPVFVSE